jgi:1-acyl-sn-glycerol-3-phosphate acyltransferase
MDSEVAVKIPDPPPAYQLDLVVGAIRPLRRVTSPKVYGMENIPDRGALLVGNHTIFGLLDVPFMIAELWKRRAIKVRALGEHAHYKVPIWRNLLETGGMVRGTRANCGELMRRGENVLVFPGGAREVNKKRGQKYQLLWENRMGFARMAIDHGYPIVPFAAVGAEEMLDVLVDGDTPVYKQVTEAIARVTGWPMLPMVRGIGLTPIPRP